MVGRAHAELRLSQLEQLLPEGTCEDMISVRNDLGWHAMESVDLIKENQSHLTSGVGMLERQKMGKFGL